MGLDTASFAREVRRWGETVHVRAVEELAADLDRVVPEDTGRLRFSQQVIHRGPGRSTIVYDARPEDGGESYASFTDEGTEPHEIRGNPLLAFVWDGQLVIVHSVQHPGTTGTQWWSDRVDDRGWDEALNSAAVWVTL